MRTNMPTKTLPAAELHETSEVAGPETVADFIEQLGGISPQRIHTRPPVTTATEADLARTKGCELVDCTIVEKAVGFLESCLAPLLIRLIGRYLDEHDIGFIAGPDAHIRFGANVRGPDVAFVRWDQVPGAEIPDVPVSDSVPSLVVEILSRGNTQSEIERKRREYFAAGVRLLWIADPRKRTVEVWTDAKTCQTLTEGASLEGGEILPGFLLPIREWFDRARQGGVRKA
jgi:Uma2 family endonuclease